MGANKVVQKSKEAKMKAAMAGGKSRKKKWAKGKVKEKLANLVMFDKAGRSFATAFVSFRVCCKAGDLRQDAERDTQGQAYHTLGGQ
eukprot:g18870.t1